MEGVERGSGLTFSASYFPLQDLSYILTSDLLRQVTKCPRSSLLIFALTSEVLRTSSVLLERDSIKPSAGSKAVAMTPKVKVLDCSYLSAASDLSQVSQKQLKPPTGELDTACASKGL